MNMNKPKGFVFYRGPSQLDGADIVGIAVLHSTNKKTGNMVQTYIMRADQFPHMAVKNDADKSVCGDCPLRPADTGVCYVLTFQGPRQVFESWKKGIYAETPRFDLITNRMVRLGAYGDPAAIPQAAWSALLATAKGWTGYTHQWKQTQFSFLKQWCQASCDSARDVVQATRDGWGTFYVIPPDEPDTNLRVDGRKQIACPFTKVGIKCAECGLCNGKSQRNIVVKAHGAKADKIREVVA